MNIENRYMWITGAGIFYNCMLTGRYGYHSIRTREYSYPLYSNLN